MAVQLQSIFGLQAGIMSIGVGNLGLIELRLNANIIPPSYSGLQNVRHLKRRIEKLESAARQSSSQAQPDHSEVNTDKDQFQDLVTFVSYLTPNTDKDISIILRRSTKKPFLPAREQGKNAESWRGSKVCIR